jgi:tRNA pseudouridine55 synthase
MARDGILLVGKPADITSAGVVRIIKRRVAGRKIGHLGTLDPFATGLLPLCIGEATKVAQFLAADDKAYTGRIRLGVETDSLDCTGRIVNEAVPGPLDRAMLARLEETFSGPQLQQPPMFSAVKQAGVPLYRLARRGIEVAREARPIDIYVLELAVAGPAELEFRVECSKGTYVRVLAADIGRALGCGGHLLALRRTRFGTFTLEDAHPLSELERGTGEVLPLLSVRAALSRLRELVVPPEAAAALRRGQQGILGRLPAPETNGEAAKVVTTAGDMVAVVEATADGGRWRLARTLAAEPAGAVRATHETLQAPIGVLDAVRNQKS